jgi:hypothetical protein
MKNVQEVPVSKTREKFWKKFRKAKTSAVTT